MIIKEQDSVARGQLVGFFSVMCEERKTGLAMGFAQLLAKKHRVLYLNFDGCAGIGCEGEYEYGLSDLFYFFLQSKERMLMKLSSVKKNMNGLDWIPPCRTYQDISQITGEQWKEFISALLESRQYEYLILDCSSQMQSVLDILEMCGKVVVPYYPVSGCIRKHEQFEQMLFCSHKEILMRRIQWIRWKQHIVLPTYPEELLYSDLEPYIREIQLEE